ncbi:hypothetical protein ATERTT37_002247 [Aspergillus terreus]
MSDFNHSDYTVGWICALPKTELVAAVAMLDEDHPVLPAADPKDMNSYILGRIGDHNVAIACLPAETTGKVSAATVAKDMLRSFPAVRFGLMVGIGGGAPYYGSQGNNQESEESDEDSENDSEDEQDIRLGDVVISLHSKSSEAVVQYDFGKSVQEKEFLHIGGQLNKPPNIVLSAVSILRSRHALRPFKISHQLAGALAENSLMATRFTHQGLEKDRLFKSDVVHKEGQKSCKSCCGPDNINLVKRKDRHNHDPQIHYGTIGSADQVMKDAILRDKWAREEKIKCFEMEAAGKALFNQLQHHMQKNCCLLFLRKVSEIYPGLSNIAANVEMLRSNHDKMESTHVLDWLTPTNYGAQQTDNLRRRQPGTGQWLLDSAEFRHWVNAESQTLFCPGIPGAGKTIMTAIVIDELYAKFLSDTSVGIAYVYCSFRQHHEQRPEVLLASLLKQLCQQQSSLPNSVQRLYDHHKKKATQPTLKETSEILHSVAAMYSRVFIIVDALDECQEYDGYRTIFLSEILTLQAKCGATIFATSRFVPEIERTFKGSMLREIRASNDDVRGYIGANISRLPAFVISSPQLQEEIKTAIVKAVDGMFLLARLHIDSLVGRTSPKSIRMTLQVLPTGSDAYDSAYKEAVERIEAQHKEQKALAKRVISWITCAQRRLSTFELQHALAVEPGACELDEDNFSPIELMVSVCAGLVTIDKADGVIRLVHYTTQEYFERTQNHWLPDAEADITRTCVTYLSFNIFQSGYCPTRDEFEDRLHSNILFDYAAHNWGHHARMSSMEGDGLILDFVQTEAIVSSFAQVLEDSRDCNYHPIETLGRGLTLVFDDPQMTGLHVAAHFGLVKLVEVLLNGQHDTSPEDVNKWTPLHWAAAYGHQDVVKLLLDKGADPNVGYSYGWTSLQLAAANGHQDVVKLLLDNDADPNVESYSGWTSLHFAVYNEYQEITSLLLDQDADPNMDDKNGLTPLHYAAKAGCQEIVKLLLDEDADPDIDDKDGLTPLHCVLMSGEQEIAKLLLDKEADPNFYDKNGSTPLHLAAEDGYQEVVKLLLDKGADTRAYDYSNKTPLHRAAGQGDQEVMKLLLGRGTDPSINKDGFTPLHSAAGGGHQEAVKMLLDMGANPNITADHGRWTPLHLAADAEELDVIKLLLDQGADPNINNVHSMTPLHYSLFCKRQEVAKLLLDKGADPRAYDKFNKTPLHYAAQNGQEEMVKILLDDGIDPNINKDGFTPLLLAAVSQCHAARMLLDKGADPNINKDGWTPLHNAVNWRKTQVVKLLLDKGADPNIIDKDGWTPLYIAAKDTNEEIVKMLLDKGANPNIADKDGRTPLHYARIRKHLEMMKLLLEKGANPDIHDGKIPARWVIERC